MVDHDNTYNDDIKVFLTFGHANLVRRGLLWAVTHNVNFGFLVVYRLSYASAMSETMSRAILHIHQPNKKEILKSLLLDQLPQWGGGVDSAYGGYPHLSGDVQIRSQIKIVSRQRDFLRVEIDFGPEKAIIGPKQIVRRDFLCRRTHK